MKIRAAFIAVLIAAATVLSSCAWSPEVTAVPVTSPWTEMNLPVKQDAVVFRSDPEEFRAVHRDDKRTVLTKYTESLKAQDWELQNFGEENGRYLVDMARGGDDIHLEFYDFDNTGVVIERKKE